MITNFLFERFPDCKIIYGVSPMVHKGVGERVFPKEFTAMSDHRIFYSVDTFGIPELDKRCVVASHGMIHVDHRLLSKDCQEMSILVSCSLLKAKIFVPPFNKWNKHTEEICSENSIYLIKWEDGWRSMEHNDFNSKITKWYLHARDFNLEKVIKWAK